jgi:hypothetical protein
MKIIFFLIFSFSIFLRAEVTVPLEESKWTALSFNNIPQNKLNFSDNKIKVSVQSSASPLVYKLDTPIDVNSFSVQLKIDGRMNESSEESKFEEDSYYRMGLVVLGENKLGALGRAFAPKWVLKLFELAPEGVGLDKIYFYNLGNNKKLLNKERIHPSSKYMFERIIEIVKEDQIQFKYEPEKPLKTAALWISIDGDQTKSTFNVEIQKIILK